MKSMIARWATRAAWIVAFSAVLSAVGGGAAMAIDCSGIGIGPVVFCVGGCAPGESCDKFTGYWGIFRQDYCRCVAPPPPPPPPPPVPPPPPPPKTASGDLPPSPTAPLRFYLNIHGTCVILGRLSMSGKIDSSDSYAHDPMLGDDFTLSGSLALASAERAADGTGVAVFVADSPVNLQIGTHLIGSVLIATYVESGSSSQFNVTLTNLRAGSVPSGYVQDLLAGSTPPAYGVVLASSTPLFDQIRSGSLPQTALSGIALGIVQGPSMAPAIPTLSTTGAAIMAALLIAAGLLLLRRMRRSPS